MDLLLQIVYTPIQFNGNKCNILRFLKKVKRYNFTYLGKYNKFKKRNNLNK